MLENVNDIPFNNKAKTISTLLYKDEPNFGLSGTKTYAMLIKGT
jgi:hypothetical protein